MHFSDATTQRLENIIQEFEDSIIKKIETLYLDESIGGYDPSSWNAALKEAIKTIRK